MSTGKDFYSDSDSSGSSDSSSSDSDDSDDSSEESQDEGGKEAQGKSEWGTVPDDVPSRLGAAQLDDSN
jgi:hypothetical protein